MVSLSHYPTHTMTLYKEKKLPSYFHPISNRIIWLLDWENHKNLDQIFHVTLKCRRDHIGDYCLSFHMETMKRNDYGDHGG